MGRVLSAWTRGVHGPGNTSTDESENKEIYHEITNSTDSLPCINLVLKWLSSCEASHSECEKRDSVQHPLPTRIIDVGITGESSVRLYNTGTTPEYGKYLTLSHCWGNSNILKLTTQNEQELQRGISLGLLPKTFRDAIYFTRAISVKYLWIDSLCILQDSVNDWKHQSALMGEIYRHGYCNIAATLSRNSNEGLFISRLPSLTQPQRIPIHWRQREDEDLERGVYYIWPSELWGSQVEQAPLNKRGWVIQERILSPRVVHFSKQLFWECQSTRACEIAPSGRPRLWGYQSQSFYTELIPTINKVSEHHPKYMDAKEINPRKAAYAVWWHLVEKYSDCDLTKRNDILAAVAGIAAIMSQAMADEYIVGLWKSTIFSDLLWRASPYSEFHHEPDATRPFPLRAPSWSWASILGKTTPDLRTSTHYPFDEDEYDTEECVVDLLHVDISTYDDGDGSEITRGCLVVFGRIFKGSWDTKSFRGNNLELFIGSDRFSGFVTLDTREDWLEQSGPSHAVMLCLPILLSTRFSFDGLLLEPINGFGRKFRRIGLFSASCKEHNSPSFEEYCLEYSRYPSSNIHII